MNSTYTTLSLIKQLLKVFSIALLIIIWGTTSSLAQVNSNQEIDNIVIDGDSEGRIFNGIGGVSAGASTRLLYDYPEKEREQILDYLFKPNYGANIQILKVEIGGDLNSTDGAEASHMRKPNEVNCNRGYEWWLMKEAKKRNPDIKLAGLAWGSPSWVGDNFWVEKNIDYHLEWLNCAEEEHDLTIDYMGGWNERPHDEKRFDWFISWKDALKDNYPHIGLIGDDRCCTNRDDLWQVVDDMYANEEYMEAIDVVGIHFACGHRSEHKECYSPENAKELEQPLWMSENSAQGHDIGGLTTTRAINRMYIDARITGYMTWSPISAWYANIELADTGLMLAEWPWSGFYLVDKNIWAFAHTAQFTEPGWKYMDSAVGYLTNGASHVALQSPNGNDFSLIIEALDAQTVQDATFSVADNFSSDSVYVWETNMRSQAKSDYFVDRGALALENNEFKLKVKPGYVYSITTTTGQIKGVDKPDADMANLMELPYEEDFENYNEGELARFYSDINGAFETAACGGGRDGMCYRQELEAQPISWAHGNILPATVLGDSRWWGNYTISTEVFMEEDGYIEIAGRVTAVRRATQITGYHLQVRTSGEWELYRIDLRGMEDNEKQVIASGNNISFPVHEWHKVALKMQGSQLTVIINGEEVDTVEDSYYTTGNTALKVSPWHHAQFDNVKITKNGDWPHFVPKHNMRIYATSDHIENTGNGDFKVENAIDGRPETVWQSEWKPKQDLPQSVTVELGGFYDVAGIVYQPRLNNSQNGMITKYNVYLSSDGVNFERVKSGTWQTGTSTKVTLLDEAEVNTEARFVRFEAEEGVDGSASIGELDIMIAD
ncbi:MAG: discoidin domain-containing protein [Balneolaceae bacterium]